MLKHFLLALSLLAICLQAGAQTKRLPGKALRYSWNSADTSWTYVSTEFRTYAGARVRSIYTEDTATPKPMLTDSFYYEANGDLAKVLNYYHFSGSPMLMGGTRYTSKRNVYGQLLTRTQETYDAVTTKSWFNLNYEGYQYPNTTSGDSDYSQHITYNPSGSSWEPVLMEDSVKRLTGMAWLRTPLSSRVYRQYINSKWETYDRTTVSTASGIVTVLREEFNNAYRPIQRRTITPGKDSTVEIEEQFINGFWENKVRSTFFWDAQGKDAGYRFEGWDAGSKVWVFYGTEERYISYYNSLGELIERISMRYNSSAGMMEPVERVVYRSFSTITAMQEEAAPAIELSLYPNPASSHVNVKVPTRTQAVSLCDAQGRVLRRIIPSGTSLLLEVTDLPKGV